MRLRIYRGGRTGKRPHPFGKPYPFNDRRFDPIRLALAKVADEKTATGMLADYQRSTTKRGHIYGIALAMAKAKFPRCQRRAINAELTTAHHQCFNHPAI